MFCPPKEEQQDFPPLEKPPPHCTTRTWENREKTPTPLRELSVLFKTEQNSLTKCYFGMNTRCQLTATPATPAPRFSQLWNSQHKFRPSWRSLPSQRCHLLATPCPGRAPALPVFPTALPALGSGDKSPGSAPNPPLFQGAHPEPCCLHGALPRSSGMALNPRLGLPQPSRVFPMCHRCGFKPFPCLETAPGAWIPSGRAGSPWNRGRRKQPGEPRQGPGQSPSPSLDFGKSLCPAQCPSRGPHWGHSEPPNPVTGGLFLTATDSEAL